MRVTLVLLVVLAVTGCGRAVSGKRLFTSHCTGCHTLTGHDTAVDGGDLAGLHMSTATMESFVRVMPTGRRLTPAQVHAVAIYVLSRR